MVDLLVQQEQDRLFSFEDVLHNRVDLSDHRDEEYVVGLVHQALVVLHLVVELLLDVILHLVGDQSAGYLVCDMAQQREVI